MHYHDRTCSEIWWTIEASIGFIDSDAQMKCNLPISGRQVQISYIYGTQSAPRITVLVSEWRGMWSHSHSLVIQILNKTGKSTKPNQNSEIQGARSEKKNSRYKLANRILYSNVQGRTCRPVTDMWCRLASGPARYCFHRLGVNRKSPEDQTQNATKGLQFWWFKTTATKLRWEAKHITWHVLDKVI